MNPGATSDSLANPARPARVPFPTLIVVPTYNERENLPELVARLDAAVDDLDVLIVDDGSPDGTADTCRELARDRPRLHLLERQGPRGLGRAYRAGFRFGIEHGYRAIGTMDADLSHAPAYLPGMLAELDDGHEVVIGSRYIRDGGTINWRLRRVLLSYAANRFSSFLLRIPVHDVTSGYRLYAADLLARIDFDAVRSSGYSFLVELLFRAHRAGGRLAEVPIVFHDRTLGHSKLRSREIYIGMLRLLSLRLHPPRIDRLDRG